jgi:hypothetical protein
MTMTMEILIFLNNNQNCIVRRVLENIPITLNGALV